MAQEVVQLRAGNKIAGIVPASIEEVFRLAKAVAASGLAPRGMNTPEQITVAIMTGAEVGLPPMFSINKIAVINGRPSLWGDAVPALLFAAGFKLKEWAEGDDDKRVAHCLVTRPSGDSTSRSFSVADARKAGLWGKSGPWQQYPDRMLQMRARGFAARDGAADVLGGLYLREEIEAEEATATVVPDAIEPPRKSAYRSRKDGDYKKLTDLLDACETDAQITEVMAASSATLALMPRSWVDHVEEYAERKRAVLLAASPNDEPLADVEGFLDKLRTERGYCNSPEDVAELREANDALLSRLSMEDWKRADAILFGEE